MIIETIASMLSIPKLRETYNCSRTEAITIAERELKDLYEFGDKQGFMDFVDNYMDEQFRDKIELLCSKLFESLTEDVEITTNANSNGIYSLFNGWLKEPVHADFKEIEDWNPTYTDFKNRAQDLLLDNDTTEIDNLIDEIYELRRASILRDGEFGEGNLIFKKLRDNGILEKLKKHKTELETKEMSL